MVLSVSFLLVMCMPKVNDLSEQRWMQCHKLNILSSSALVWYSFIRTFIQCFFKRATQRHSYDLQCNKGKIVRYICGTAYKSNLINTRHLWTIRELLPGCRQQGAVCSRAKGNYLDCLKRSLEMYFLVIVLVIRVTPLLVNCFLHRSVPDDENQLWPVAR